MRIFGKWFGKEPCLFGAGVVLPVDDLEATTKYYCDKLGFTLDFLMGDPATHASVTRGSVGIQFTKAPPGFQPGSYPGWTYIFVENIEALNAQHLANGVQVNQPLGNREHGMREYEIQDCNGYRIRFGQYL